MLYSSAFCKEIFCIRPGIYRRDSTRNNECTLNIYCLLHKKPFPFISYQKFAYNKTWEDINSHPVSGLSQVVLQMSYTSSYKVKLMTNGLSKPLLLQTNQSDTRL